MKTTQGQTQTMAKTRTRTQASAPAQASRQTLIAAITVAPAVIGLWSVACLVGATITSGGPLALAYGWIQAVTGI